MIRNFETPGHSVAVGRSGMAATSHPMATVTAIDVLKAGGTAIDAAVAACAVQCVVEAGSTGVGGDCFVLMAPNGTDKVLAYNGSGRTPAGLTAEGLAARGVTSLERSSPHSVTIPGAVDAWTRLVADHGRMPMSELLGPAIALARDGYALTPRVVDDLAAEAAFLAPEPVASRLFLTADKKAPPVGTLQKQVELSQTLEAIGREGRDAFYRGDVAADMVETLQARGGFHKLSDFAEAAGNYVQPITASFRGYTVHECPPNGQGLIALMILKILERLPPKSGPLDPDTLTVEVEAARLAYAARGIWLADPDASDLPISYLLSDELADELAAKINPKQRLADMPAFVPPKHADTVYISVVDKDRNAVSFINSIFFPYGSGIVAPKSGVLLQNRGQSFSLNPGHPNYIGPRKRPMHTIIPGMLTRNGRVVMPYGVMGGHYQAMGQAYFLSRVLDHGMDLQQAMEFPRLFPLPGTAIVEAEGRILAEAGVALTRRGYEVRACDSPIGGSQAIWIDEATGSLFGGSDHRKDGCALGY